MIIDNIDSDWLVSQSTNVGLFNVEVSIFYK